MLHLGIRPLLNIPGFGEAMSAAYLTFLAPDELDALLRVVDPRAWLARLGLGFQGGALWSSRGRQTAVPGYQQLELPFEGLDGQAV